jgi:hypothetical protein
MQLRQSARLGLSHLGLLACNKPRDLCGRIIYVARNDSLDRAYDYAGRLKTGFDTVSAVVAFLGGVRVGINIERVIGTRLHAALATYAPVAVEIDYAVIAPEERGHRAYRYAGGIVAVIATKHAEVAARIRVLPLFYILYPGAKSAERNFVFRFAGYSAGMTSDALSVVYNKAVSHIERFSLYRNDRGKSTF